MIRRSLPTLALFASLAAPAAAQSMSGQGGGGMMQMDHAAMMRMDSLDARLDSLLGVMRAARGDKKVAAMSALLGELVEQHLAMRREMHQRMMADEMGGGMGHDGMGRGGQGGGMQHDGGMRHEGGTMGGMGTGPSRGAAQPKMNCPMMSPDSTAPAAGGHDQHH